MKSLQVGCALIALALGATQAAAQDTLKIAVGQINNWENQAPTLGEDAGIFKKHNLKIEAFGTQGAGETIQAVVSGSADLGAGVGVAGVMRAFSKGAPVRILLPAFTGTGDLYWYVKADSPIKTLKDATAQQHDRVFDQRLELEQHRGGVRPGARRQGEADRDRRPARHADAGDDRADRHRLGGAAVRREGDQGRQDPHHRARQRRALAARADRARHHRQRERARRRSTTRSCASSRATARRSTGCMPIRRRWRCIRTR